MKIYQRSVQIITGLYQGTPRCSFSSQLHGMITETKSMPGADLDFRTPPQEMPACVGLYIFRQAIL